MKNLIKLKFIKHLDESISRNSDLIQVVIGPRQVGKTTGVLTYLESQNPAETHYVSADGQISQPAEWLEEQWILTRSKAPKGGLLVIDEIQKVENWSEMVKKLWDQQKLLKTKLRLILLGSSSLEIQKGLSESLTGRYQMHSVHHWNFAESKEAYNLNLEEFLVFGGYPGSYRFISNKVEWLNYINESIINTVIGKDILSIARVKSPSLFKQSFYLACSYGGQEISYTKLLGQLQSKGNVELIKHYLELFEGAFLLKQLFKYSNKKTLSRSSSPKILPLCPSLYTTTLDADLDSAQRGRAFEIAVGCELSRLPGSLYYWREGKYEVDYVYKFGKKLFAIEVKSGRKRPQKSLSAFTNQFPEAQPLIVHPNNFSSFKEQFEH